MSMRGCIRVVTGSIVVAVCLGAVAQEQPGARVPQPQATQPAPGQAQVTTQPTTGPAPRVELSAREFDLGEVWQGAPAKREIRIKNAGSVDMTVSVKSTCGCTVVTNPKTPLAPGEATAFEISYDTKRIGKVEKKVIVTTNDPAEPNVDIIVKGNVKPIVLITPTTGIAFSDLEPASHESITLKLENKFDRPLALKLKEGQDFGRFDIVLKEVKPGQEYELTAATKPPLLKGWNPMQVVLETGFEPVPTIVVPLQAQVQPRVMAFPSTLGVTPDMLQATQRPVSVDFRRDKPVEITGAAASLAAIKWERAPDEPVSAERKRASHRLLVTLPAYADFPAEGATLEIYTDDQDPEYQKLEVRIMKVTPGAQSRPVNQNPAEQPQPAPSGKPVSGTR